MKKNKKPRTKPLASLDWVNSQLQNLPSTTKRKNPLPLSPAPRKPSFQKQIKRTSSQPPKKLLSGIIGH